MKRRNPTKYLQKFNEAEVAAVVNQNKRMIQPHAELGREVYERMQNIYLIDKYSSAEYYDEHEIFLGQENGDDDSCDNAMYNSSVDIFKILQNIYQDSIINSIV